MQAIRMTDLALAGKRVLIREDLNVPIADGRVTSDARIRAALPTCGWRWTRAPRDRDVPPRPPEGGRARSGASARARRGSALRAARQAGPAARRTGSTASAAEPGEVVLLENVRFNKGEKKDDERSPQRMAALCDMFVMDAFGTAHRAEASTHGVALAAPVACAGPLLVARARRAGARAATARAAAGRGRRRLEGLHQARRCSRT